MISLVIPVYNEKASLEELLRRVVAVDMPKELVVVDDCSTDGSREILVRLAERGLDALAGAQPSNQNTLVVLFQETNQGKGAALRRGFELRPHPRRSGARIRKRCPSSAAMTFLQRKLQVGFPCTQTTSRPRPDSTQAIVPPGTASCRGGWGN